MGFSQRILTLWLLVQLAAVCSAASTSATDTRSGNGSTATSISTASSASSSFQVKYPYSVALPTLHAEIKQCAAVSGFTFRNNTPTVWQLARMCFQPSCAALATELLSLGTKAAPSAVVSAFHNFAEPMVNFCWYQRLPDEPCPENPLTAYVARVKDKDDACFRATGVTWLEPNGTVLSYIIGMYLTTLTTQCPDVCTELASRIYYMYDRMPCAKYDQDDDLNHGLIQVSNQFMFTFCNMATQKPYNYKYTYRPDWPIPTIPPEPTTLAPPVKSNSSSSSDGSFEREEDVGDTTGSDIGGAETVVEDGVSVTYRSKIPKSLNTATANTENDETSTDPEALGDDASKVSSKQLGVVAVATEISTKADAQGDDEPSASASPVSASEPRSNGHDYTSSIVVCVATVAVFAAFLLFVERRRKRDVVLQTNKLQTPQGGEHEERYSVFTDPLSSFSSGLDSDLVSTSSSNMMSSIWGGSGVFLRKTIPLESIKDVRLIGTGGFGVVFLVQDVRSKRLLASKRLIKNQLTSDKIATFYDEIQLVSKLDHPCIVSYIGATWTNRSDLQALFEYMDGGDLRTHLDVTPVAPWSIEKVDIAINIADALVYVHSTLATPLVHRDLKSRNILLSRSPLRAKLSDFGVARRLSHNQSMTTGVGTSRWLAPEVIIGGGEYDVSCDIYSFGVVLSELDTHRLPFADCSAGGAGSMLPEITILSMVGLDGLKPSFSESCPPQLLVLAQDCLAYDPQQRPSAEAVAAGLRRIRASMHL